MELVACWTIARHASFLSVMTLFPTIMKQWPSQSVKTFGWAWACSPILNSIRCGMHRVNCWDAPMSRLAIIWFRPMWTMAVANGRPVRSMVAPMPMPTITAALQRMMTAHAPLKGPRATRILTTMVLWPLLICSFSLIHL